VSKRRDEGKMAAAHSVVDRLLASPSMNRELATGGADFIRALAQAASSFRPDEQGKGPGHGALVDAVLRQPWRESEVLCVAVIEFVQELVSAVPAFVPKGIDALVLSFVPAKSAAAAEMLLPEAVLLPRVHEALRGVLRACPLGIGHLYSSIKEHLPHRRFDLHVHVGFLRPTLQLLEYCHALRPRVLHLLVERLVELDAHVAQQLRALEEARDADDTIFQVESDTTQDELYKMRLNAEKLDEMLVMLCKFISATASPSQRAAAKAAAVDAATDRTATWAAATAAAAAAAATAATSRCSSSGSSSFDVTLSKLEVATGEDDEVSAAGGALASPESRKRTPRGMSSDPSDHALEDVSGAAASAERSPSSSHAPSAAAPLSCSGFADASLDVGTPPNKVRRSASVASPSSSGSLAYLAAPGDPAAALFETLFSAFRASVLPTYKCRAVQFLLFYACSFDAAFTRSFLQQLLLQVRAEHVHGDSRIACAAYVASYVARATFVGVEMVVHVARELLVFVREYQEHAVARLGGQPAQLDVQLHGPFYAAVQGLLYLICYKHELLQGVSQLPDGHGFVKRDDSSSSQRSVLHEVGLSLHDVLHGPLNPLKFCLEAIAIEFERLAICDVSELLDANERVVVASNTMGGLRNQLEDFFPFDPLHGFKQMSALIAPFYQEWRAQRDSEARDSNLSALSRSVDDDHALSHSLQVRARPLLLHLPILLPPPSPFAARTITIRMRSTPAGALMLCKHHFQGTERAFLWRRRCAPPCPVHAPRARRARLLTAGSLGACLHSVLAYRECRSRPRRPRTKGPSRALWPITCAGGCTRANP